MGSGCNQNQTRRNTTVVIFNTIAFIVFCCVNGGLHPVVAAVQQNSASIDEEYSNYLKTSRELKSKKGVKEDKKSKISSKESKSSKGSKGSKSNSYSRSKPKPKPSWSKDKHSGSKSSSSEHNKPNGCLLYTSPSPRDGILSRMPSSA